MRFNTSFTMSNIVLCHTSNSTELLKSHNVLPNIHDIKQAFEVFETAEELYSLTVWPPVLLYSIFRYYTSICYFEMYTFDKTLDLSANDSHIEEYLLLENQFWRLGIN